MASARLAGLGAVRSSAPDPSKMIWDAKKALYAAGDRMKKAKAAFERGDFGAVIALEAEAKAALAVAEAAYAPVRRLPAIYRSSEVEDGLRRAAEAGVSVASISAQAAVNRAEQMQEEPEWVNPRYGQAMPEEEPDYEGGWRVPSYGPEDFPGMAPSRADLLFPGGGRGGGYHGLAGGGRRRRRRRR